MINRVNILERLEAIEQAVIINGLALTKLQAECHLNGYSSNRDRINELSRNTDRLLKEMKIVRLLCTTNEN